MTGELSARLSENRGEVKRQEGQARGVKGLELKVEGLQSTRGNVG
jgi:hypothetical protein